MQSYHTSLLPAPVGHNPKQGMTRLMVASVGLVLGAICGVTLYPAFATQLHVQPVASSVTVAGASSVAALPLRYAHAQPSVALGASQKAARSDVQVCRDMGVVVAVCGVGRAYSQAIPPHPWEPV